MNISNSFEISVCVCTYKRPVLLLQLLTSLVNQSIPHSQFEVIVVDNDKAGSARQVVAQVSERFTDLNVYYEVEPTPGISFARNKTVALARGRYLAFIDDDEWAVSHWLADLLACLNAFEVDAVLGPVLPHFPPGSRSWAIQSKFFERPRYPTGTRIAAKQCRTSNALVSSRKIKERQPEPFDRRFALSGAEDLDYFQWLERQGGRMAWCDTASVNEVVPLPRQTLSFVLERCLRTSTAYWRLEYAEKSKFWVLAKAATGLVGGIAFLLAGCIALPFGMWRSIPLWRRGANGIGRVNALTNFELIGYGEHSR